MDGLTSRPDDRKELPVEVPSTGGSARVRLVGRADPRVLVAIALGAMLGATARYELATWMAVSPGGFPWPTFWTNVSGSLVLGALVVILIERSSSSRYVRPFAGTGVLGAYTTFSTFSVETDLLIKAGHLAMALAYVAASLAVGLAAAWFGIAIGQRLSNLVIQRKERQ